MAANAQSSSFRTSWSHLRLLHDAMRACKLTYFDTGILVQPNPFHFRRRQDDRITVLDALNWKDPRLRARETSLIKSSRKDRRTLCSSEANCQRFVTAPLFPHTPLQSQANLQSLIRALREVSVLTEKTGCECPLCRVLNHDK